MSLQGPLESHIGPGIQSPSAVAHNCQHFLGDTELPPSLSQLALPMTSQQDDTLVPFKITYATRLTEVTSPTGGQSEVLVYDSSPFCKSSRTHKCQGP